MSDAVLFEKALLVEDDSSHQFLIKRALTPYVKELDIVATVSEAKAKSLSSYSIIVSDLALPDSKDIAHVAEFINLSSHVPVLVLTSSNSISYAVDAMKMGAGDFLVKNFGEDFNSVVALSLKRISIIEESKKEKERLEREGKALRHAIEYSDDAFAVVSATGEILYRNNALNAVTKSPQSNNFQSLIVDSAERREEVVQKIEAVLKAIAQKEQAAAFSQEFKAEDKFYNITVSAIGNLCVVRIQNITEQRKREKLQRDLISTTSHDLKGPLSTVLLSSEMLLEDRGLDNVEMVRKIARQIGASAQGAINLIEEFLSAKSIKEGVLVLHPKAIDGGARLKEIVDEFQVTARARGITLSFDAPGQGVSFTVDSIALGRMVGNLLSNGLKFTPKGGKIIVSLCEEEEGVVISVSDSGRGIAPEDLPKLFEKFSRVGKEADVAGTGLGLFVVKSLAAAHGGAIEVSSIFNQGTTFTIRLPKNPVVGEDGAIRCLSL